MRYITEGQVVVWKEGKLARITIYEDENEKDKCREEEGREEEGR